MDTTKPNNRNGGKMKRVSAGMLVLLILFLVVGISEGQENLTYKNEQFKFSVNYPTSWKMKERDRARGIWKIFEKQEISRNFKSAVNVVVEKFPHPMPLDRFAPMVEQSNRPIFSDYKKLSEKSTSVFGLPAIEIVFTGKVGNVALKGKTVCFVKGDDIVCQILCLASETAYSQDEQTFDSIIKSFKFFSE